MRCLLVWLALALLGPTPAMADSDRAAESLQSAAARFLSAQASATYVGSAATVDIGPIDERLDLSNCAKPSFFLPPGSRLWGAGTLGVQCEPPSNLNLYLTYRIRLKGPALVARRPLPSHYAPVAADLALRKVEYTMDPGRYPRDPDNLHGASLTAPVAKGSPITVNILHVRPIIQAGQQVRIVAEGPGYQVSQIGWAQRQAGVGDLLRLKLSSGRYVQGIVREDGTVSIKP